MFLKLFYAILSFMFLSGGAFSQLHVCNEKEERLQVAVGVDVAGDFYTFGWDNLASGECGSDIYITLSQEGVLRKVERFYLHYRNTISNPTLETEVGVLLCVDDIFDSFWVEFADSTCAKRGYVEAGFIQVDLSSSGGFIFVSESDIDTLD